MQQKVLIIGASGLVGRYLTKGAEQHFKVIAASRKNSDISLDITDRQQTLNLVRAIEPSVIFLTAAFTDVKQCETNPEGAKVNVNGTKNVADAVKAIHSKLVFFSTDYLFDGESGPYSEEHLPKPKNEYGKQKLLAEHYICSTLTASSWLIIRTCGVFGVGGSNFAQRIISTLQKEQQLVASSEEFFTPTYAEDLQKITLDLIKRGTFGVYNIAGVDITTRYAFANKIAKRFYLDKENKLLTETKAVEPYKPKVAGLSNKKLIQLLKKSNSPRPSTTDEALWSFYSECKNK